MSFLFLTASAVTPSLLLMWFFHRRDAFPEPARVLWTTFALGVASVVPVVAVELPVGAFTESVRPVMLSSFLTAFLAAAVPEEVFKFLVLWRYSFRHRAFDEPMDGIVYGVASSLGFATLENVLYVSSSGFGVALTRAVLAVPAHAFFGAIMGYYVGQARWCEESERRGMIVRALGWPTLLHGLYDYPLMAADALSTTPHAGLGALMLPTAPLLVIVCWRWTLRLVRKLRAEQDGGAAAAEVVAAMPVPPKAAAVPAVPMAAAMPATVAPAIPVAPARRAGGGRLLSWMLVLGGGGVAAFGGLVTLVLLAGLLLGDSEVTQPADLVVGWVVLGLLPGGVGTAAFARGLKRLNRPAAAGAA